MNAAPTFPRSAPTIIAIGGDPAWAGYLLAACQAVTGEAAETPQLAAYRIIAERKARQIKSSAAPRLKPATLRCLNVGIVDQFWREIDDAVIRYHEFRSRLALEPALT